MLGGFTGAREATEEDQGVLNAVADELRDSHGLNHTNFRAVQGKLKTRSSSSRIR